MAPVLLWLLLVAIGVGFPLLALAVGRRVRLPEGPLVEDDLYALTRRHRLTAGEQLLIERALRQGERVEQPRLRPLVTQLAQSELRRRRREAEQVRRSLRRWARPVVLAAGLVVLALLLGPSRWRPHLELDSLILVIGPVASAVLERRRRRRLMAAMQANQDP